MKKFKAYEDAVIAKAKLAEEKKNKALIDAKNKATEENDKLKLKNKRSEVYNEVKYVRIAEQITTEITKAILDSNEANLIERKAKLETSTFETVTVGLDMDIIDEVLTADLKQSFLSAKTNSLKLIDVKLKDYATQKENVILEAKSTVTPVERIEVAAEVLDNGVSDIPSPPGTKHIIEPFKGPDLSSLNDAEFYRYIKGVLKLLYRMVEDRITINKVPSPSLYKLQTFLKSIVPNL